jgi:hypothetical protein
LSLYIDINISCLGERMEITYGMSISCFQCIKKKLAYGLSENNLTFFFVFCYRNSLYIKN